MPKKRSRYKRVPLLPSFGPQHYHEMRQFLSEMGSMFVRGSEQSLRSFTIDGMDGYLEQKRYYDNAGKAVKFILNQLRQDELRHKGMGGEKESATG